MLPYSISSLESTFSSYSEYYIFKYGHDKYEKIERKLILSNKLAELNGVSIQMNGVPTARDFLSVINSIPYFMFAGTDTTILACLFAIKLWDERINKTYHLATRHTLDDKVYSLFNMFGLI